MQNIIAWAFASSRDMNSVLLVWEGVCCHMNREAHLAAQRLWRNFVPKHLAFRKHKERSLPCQHSYIITLSFLTVSAHYSKPVALRGKQGAAMQDRALACTRKSCRKLIMEKSLSISDPLLLNGLFIQQALSPGSGRKHLFMSCSHSPGSEIGLKTLGG